MPLRMSDWLNMSGVTGTPLARWRRQYEGEVSRLSPECFEKMASWFARSAVEDPAATAHRPDPVFADDPADTDDDGVAAPGVTGRQPGESGDLMTPENPAAVLEEYLIDRSLPGRQALVDRRIEGVEVTPGSITVRRGRRIGSRREQIPGSRAVHRRRTYDGAVTARFGRRERRVNGRRSSERSTGARVHLPAR